jgi:hypothetical protein
MWAQTQTVKAQKLVTGAAPPREVGYFNRIINNCQVSLVLPNPNEKGGMHMQTFVK